MKTTTTTFLEKQRSNVIRPDFRLELLEQFAGEITDRDGDTNLQLNGDATGLFASGDVFVIPHDDFETEYIITGTLWSSPKTLIACTGTLPVADDIEGLFVAKKRNISAWLMDGGLSPIRTNTEGQALNASLADDVEITLDNTDSHFWNIDGSSGILNSGNTFWVRLYFSFKDNPLEVLYFGGIVEPETIQPVENKVIQLTCSGHLRELERYPGWKAWEEGDPATISGLEVVSVTPGPNTIEGLKRLKYKFPDGKGIDGLTVRSVTNNTPLGLHTLKFMPPDLFQFDGGNWTPLTEGSEDQQIQSNEFHNIRINAPKKFDLIARQDLLLVEDKVSPKVTQAGKATLQFDNGIVQQMLYDFEYVVMYDATSTDFADITRECTSDSIYKVSVFDDLYDVIYFMSSKPFLGIDIEIVSSLSGATLAFAYSKSFGGWDTLSPTDGTSNFSSSGAITWDMPADWVATNCELDSANYEKMYIIRISLMAISSGSAAIVRAKRMMRIIGNDGTVLNLKCWFENLPHASRMENIALVEDSSGNLEFRTALQMLPLGSYLTELLTAAKYNSANMNADDIELTFSSNILSVWGPPPRIFYEKKCTAICVDTDTTPETIYLGIEDELWKVTEETGFTKMGQLSQFEKPSGYNRSYKCNIVRLYKNLSGDLDGFAVADYSQEYDPASYGNPEMARPAIVFRSSDLLTITSEYEVVDTLPCCFPGTHFFRNGNYSGSGTNEAGRYNNCGENISIPTAQACWFANADVNDNNIYDAQGLWSTTYSGNARTSDITTAYQRFVLPPGFYTIKDEDNTNGDIGNLGLAFTYGQQGFIVYNWDSEEWFILRWNGTNYYVARVAFNGTITTVMTTGAMGGYAVQFCAGCNSVYASNEIFCAFMIWDESGGTSPGDLSDCTIYKFYISGGWAGTALFQFYADTIEANQSVSIGEEKYCTVIELCYNEEEETLHGVLLNRNDLTYHYFVLNGYDLYSTQTGTGFTYSSGQQIKNIVYDSETQKCYAVVTDNRYGLESAFLVRVEFVAPGGSPDGTEITLTKITDIMTGETDSVALAVGGGGRIYGVSAPNKNYLWHYDNSFFPRFFMADTGDDNVRDILDKLAEAVNMLQSIDSDRVLNFLTRENNKGSMVISEATHYIDNSMEPVKHWPHRYDGVEVAWQNPLTGESGSERVGSFGFQRRILKISNPFIQYPQLAYLVASKLFDYFSLQRKECAFKTIPLWQIDNRDKIVFDFSQGDFDFDPETEWIVTDLEYDHNEMELSIKALEKI